MDTWQIEKLVYLLILGGLIAFMGLSGARRHLGRSLRYLAIWLLIFLGALVAVGLWQDIRQTALPRQSVMGETGRIVLPRAQDGHYYATLDVNGTPLRFVVDTGATGIVLSRADAARAGFDPDSLGFFSRAMTANGVVRTAPVRLDRLRLGPHEDRNVPAYVNDGAMEGSLLGMDYLQRFARVEIADNRMVLER